MDSTMVGVQPTVLPADAIGWMPDVPLESLDGVEHKVLWRNESSMAGLLTVHASHRLGSTRIASITTTSGCSRVER